MWRFFAMLALASCGKEGKCLLSFPKHDEGMERCRQEYDSEKAAERAEEAERAAERRDKQRARDAYRAAIEPCKRADPPACMRVAAWRLNESGHTPDAIDGPLRIACGGKIADACYLLAQRAPLAAQQVAHYEQACAAGHALACYEAGTLEPARSVALDTRGCELREYAACERLGNAYVDGRRVAVDRDAGLRLLKLACQQGRKTACGRVGALGVEGP